MFPLHRNQSIGLLASKHLQPPEVIRTHQQAINHPIPIKSFRN